MSLSDFDFETESDRGRIKIHPVDWKTIQPASYDLHIGRVIGNVQLRHKQTGSNSVPVYLLKPGETAAILTLETVYLSEDIAGQVNLTNEFASQGVHLLNPGHIDPGWGLDQEGGKDGLKLTAFVRNLSDQTLDLEVGHRFLTLTLSYLKTRTTQPYGKTHPTPPEHVREANLALQAQKWLALASLSELLSRGSKI